MSIILFATSLSLYILIYERTSFITSIEFFFIASMIIFSALIEKFTMLSHCAFMLRSFNAFDIKIFFLYKSLFSIIRFIVMFFKLLCRYKRKISSSYVFSSLRNISMITSLISSHWTSTSIPILSIKRFKRLFTLLGYFAIVFIVSITQIITSPLSLSVVHFISINWTINDVAPLTMNFKCELIFSPIPLFTLTLKSSYNLISTMLLISFNESYSNTVSLNFFSFVTKFSISEIFLIRKSKLFWCLKFINLQTSLNALSLLI